MSAFNKIAAIVFLSIYCGIVFHNVVPHTHAETAPKNQQDNVEHASHDHHHSHHHAHHTHHENEENSWADLILGFLGDLEHTDLGADHFESFTAQSNHFSTAHFDVAPLDFTPLNHISSTFTEEKRAQEHIGHPKILYEQQFACSSPLRGPPSIS